MHVAELISRLGAQRVAERLGLRKSAVPMWVARGAIPREHHLAIWTMAIEAGVDWTPPGAEAIRARLAEQPAAKVA
jgi:hypothetical protein